MSEKIAFTSQRLRALKAPTKGRKFVYDTRMPGLALCLTSANRRVYYLYKWFDGKPQRVRLGTFEELSIDDARDAAQTELAKMARGIDPAAERRARRNERTVESLWGDWLEVHAKPRKKTWRDDERQYKKYLEPFHKRKLSSLTPGKIAKWHAAIGVESGHTQANRAKALLSTLLSYAVKLGYLTVNPCQSVPGFPEQSRERFLLPSEMKAFFDALTLVGEPWHDFFQICLFTGARRGNVAAMQWKEIDLDRMTWTIPGAKTKNSRPAIIALAPPAVLILQNRLEVAIDSPFVFPSYSASGHIEDPRKAWERVRASSGLGDLRMHDLRRSLGSWQATAGASLAVIGASLGHADLKSTQVYARLQLDPVRQSVGAAAIAMQKAAKLIDVEPKNGGAANGE